MSEKDRNSQDQKPEICGLAIAAPLLVVLGYIALVLLELLLGTVRRAWLVLGFSMWGLSSLVGLVMGVVALLRIKKSNGRLAGRMSAILGIVAAVFAIWFLAVCSTGYDRPRQVLCRANLLQLGVAIQIYSDDYSGKYPTADKWCDLLLQCTDVTEKIFVCKSAGEGRCHYAINPNAELSSPADMVLLFETKGGWNQFGGPELLTLENHKGKGCNILFNDGHVEFVKPEKLRGLRWDVEESEKRKTRSAKP